MKHLINIIVSNLGDGYTNEETLVQNGHDFTIYKKYQEEFYIVMKNDYELSEVLISKDDVTNWINNHV